MKEQVLTVNNIVLGADYPDRWEAIRACGEILFQQGYIRREYIDDMMERERLFGVYMGNGIAIPHGVEGSERNILHSGISVLQLKRGVDFGTGTAYLLFGIAGKDGEHIELLSRIAQVCMETEKVERMRITEDKEEMLQILNSVPI